MQLHFPGLEPLILPAWTSLVLVNPGAPMARRHSWAKVYCDLLRHPKIIGRPDSDVRLFLGLILHAKEYSPDHGLVQLTPTDMRNAFGIKAPMKAVLDGLAYFIKEGVLQQEAEHVRIRDFATRQAADSAAERMQRWRDGTRDESVTKRNNGVYKNVTAPSTRASPEVEVEVEDVVSSKSGESEGREPTACETVDNSGFPGLNPEQRAHALALLKASDVPGLAAYFASLRGAK